MHENDIYKNFKATLGKFCATCQLTELSVRYFQANYDSLVASPNGLNGICQQYHVLLADSDIERVLPNIPLSYIIYIQACFEDFVISYCQLLKKYGVNEYIERDSSESALECLCNNIYGKKLPVDIKPIYKLCEYYRLVRNKVMHKHINDDLSKKFKMVSQIKYDTLTNIYGELNAPNPFTRISFDDFILFSKSCLQLAQYIHNTINLDYLKLLQSADEDERKQIKQWKNLTPERKNDAIKNYIRQRYRCDERFDECLPQLVAFVNSLN